MKQVYLMIYDLGGGHRSIANALHEVIKQHNLSWQVHIVEFFHDIIGTDAPHNVYNNFVLKKKWAKIINEPILVPSFKLQVRIRYQAWRSLLENYWQEHQPDLVVSLLPYVNKLLKDSLERTFPKSPFVTCMTDFADVPPNLWIEPQEQFLVCPSQIAVEQAKSYNYSDERIIQTSGVVIHPRFNEPKNCDRSSERQSLGLDPNLPTGLVLFGSYGSPEMIEIAKNLEKSDLKLQLIFICGRNEELANKLKNIPSRLPKLVEGFTKEIPYYMDLSDFFISKPGSVGISEAVARKLPVITECNSITLFQERSAAAWLENKQFGIVVNSFVDIERAVAKLIDPENFLRYQANVKAYDNQAVFEVVDRLETILENSYFKVA
jgi:UDP-N-acetylglucosamine:LPS N-acetylglucosamine transferase